MLDQTPNSVNQRVISPIIGDKVPLFVKETFPNFRKFIESYIKWGEENGNVFQILGLLKSARDVDLTADQFIVHLVREFAPTLADDRFVVGKDVPVYNSQDWSFLKYIGEYYRNKGTNKSFDYFFRLLYNLDTIVKHPVRYILTCSDGGWVQPVSLFVKVTTDGFVTNHYPNLYIPLEFSTDGWVTRSYLGTIYQADVVLSGDGYDVLRLDFRDFTLNNYNYTSSQIDIRPLQVDVDSLLVTTDITAFVNAFPIGQDLDILNTNRYILIGNGGDEWQVGEKIFFKSSSPFSSDAIIEVTSITPLSPPKSSKPPAEIVTSSNFVIPKESVFDLDTAIVYVPAQNYYTDDLIFFDGGYYRALIDISIPNGNFYDNPKSSSSWRREDVLNPNIGGTPQADEENILFIGQTLSSTTIQNGLYTWHTTVDGRGYFTKISTAINDVIYITSTGQFFYLSTIIPGVNPNYVFLVDNNEIGGAISGFNVVSPGFTDTTFDVYSKLTSYGKDEQINIVYGAFSVSHGIKTNGRSSLSDRSIVLEDNYLFQTHSYVIDIKGEFPSDFNVEEYVRTNHPVGFQYFFMERPFTGSISYGNTDICTNICSIASSNGSITCTTNSNGNMSSYFKVEGAMGMGTDPLEVFVDTKSIFKETVLTDVDYWFTMSDIVEVSNLSYTESTTASIDFWFTFSNMSIT